jgi:probable HAF family extracellular repeat protein
MRRWSRPHRALAACTAVLTFAACADDPVQPRDTNLSPTSRPSFALADGAPAIDLGTLGGNNSRATAINDSGAVVGYALDTADYPRAFIWTPANGMRPLNGIPSRVHSLATDVNASGTVAGYVDSITTGYAFIWSPTAGVKYLGSLGGGSSYAYAINNNGDVVGSSNTASGAWRAFIWTKAGGMRDLGMLGGAACASGTSTAWDINDRREVVGFSCADSSGDRAFLWTDSAGMRNLGTLGGFTSNAHGINNRGEVVGVAQTANGTDHAFVWSDSGGMRDLGTFGGDRSFAHDINDLGEIVGESNTIDIVIQHGFLWTAAGGMRKLLGLSGQGSAYGINRSGQVAGWSQNTAGYDRATAWGVDTANPPSPPPPPPPPPPPVNRPPVVSAGGPYAGLEASPIAFSGSATDPDGDTLSVSWRFGDGAVASIGNTSHTYADNGSFIATFTATDMQGLRDTATATVSIANVAPVVDASASATVVSGGTFALSTSFSDPGTLDAPWRISVDWGDGARTADSTNSQSAPVVWGHRYFRAGTYTAYVAIADKDGGFAADSVVLEVLRFATTIDVDPKSTTNTIFRQSGGQTLAVALLSTPAYDARTTTLASIVITNGSGSGTRLRGTRVGRDYEYSDANRDGRPDLLLWFYKSDMTANGDLSTATTRLILLGDASDGRQTRGENVVSVR